MPRRPGQWFREEFNNAYGEVGQKREALDQAGIGGVALRPGTREHKLMDQIRENRRKQNPDDPTGEPKVDMSPAEAVDKALADLPTEGYELPAQEQVDAVGRGSVAVTHVAELETQAAQADFEAASRAMNAEAQDLNKLH